jgi:hypothetical protein
MYKTPTETLKRDSRNSDVRLRWGRALKTDELEGKKLWDFVQTFGLFSQKILRMPGGRAPPEVMPHRPIVAGRSLSKHRINQCKYLIFTLRREKDVKIK